MGHRGGHELSSKDHAEKEKQKSSVLGTLAPAQERRDSVPTTSVERKQGERQFLSRIQSEMGWDGAGCS